MSASPGAGVGRGYDGYEGGVREEEEMVDDRYADADVEDDGYEREREGYRGMREGVGRVVQPHAHARRAY